MRFLPMVSFLSFVQDAEAVWVLQALAEGLFQVCRIVMCGKGMDPFLEMIPGLEFLVKGDAGGIEVEKGKPLVPDPFHQGFFKGFP